MGGKPLALILAGGSGTRFWPWSRPDRPKQYLDLIGRGSMLTQTVARLDGTFVHEQLYVCGVEAHGELLTEHVPTGATVVLEPESKNTAAALMLSLSQMISHGVPLATPMVVMPSDHYIADPKKLLATIDLALEFASAHSALVTLGVVPTHPHTGYGYIEAENSDHTVRHVRRFVEKPDRMRAEQFLQDPNFLWNSGIFVWTLGSIVRAFEKHMPQTWARFVAAQTPGEIRQIYSGIESTPIDVGVLERADNVFVIEVDVGWSDVGSWNALHGLHSSDPNANLVISGNAKLIDTQGCLVKTSQAKRVALVGVKNLIVVEDGDTLLIAERSQDQQVRKAAEFFES